MNRSTLAEMLASGMSGWLQLQVALGVGDFVGEDSARVQLLSLIRSTNLMAVTSMRPTNWPTNTKKRIDIALMGRNGGTSGWVGVAELKWPHANVGIVATRQSIVEDCLRAAFTATNNINAKYVILGCLAPAEDQLFTVQHTRSSAAEQQRVRFRKLFSRDLTRPIGKLPYGELNQSFAGWNRRLPPSITTSWKRRIMTELLAKSESIIGTTKVGHVYVWQCSR